MVRNIIHSFAPYLESSFVTVFSILDRFFVRVYSVRSIFRSFVHLLVSMFVISFFRSFLCLLLRWFMFFFARPFFRSFSFPFAHQFFRLLTCSFIRHHFIVCWVGMSIVHLIARAQSSSERLKLIGKILLISDQPMHDIAFE